MDVSLSVPAAAAAAPAVATIAASVESGTSDTPEEQNDAAASTVSKKRKFKYAGGLTEDSQCKRCVRGPKYKKGHHISCPKSAYYGGKGGSKSKPTQRRSPAAASSYAALERAVKKETNANLYVEECKKALSEAIKQKDIASQKVEEARKHVLEAELKEPDEWNTMFLKLREYGQVHGNVLFPRGCQQLHPEDADYQELCKWVKAQRHKRQRLGWQRKVALDDIGFEWDPFEATWTKQCLDLEAYKEKNGDLNVLGSDKEYSYLIPWIAQQRRQYKLYQDGEKSQLNADRIKRLEELGFDWGKLEKKPIENATSNSWERQLGSLLLYKTTNGNFDVPNDYALNPTLKPWMDEQRKLYSWHKQGKPSFMSTGQIKSLEDIGFPWDEDSGQKELSV